MHGSSRLTWVWLLSVWKLGQKLRIALVNVPFLSPCLQDQSLNITFEPGGEDLFHGSLLCEMSVVADDKLSSAMRHLPHQQAIKLCETESSLIKQEMPAAESGTFHGPRRIQLRRRRIKSLSFAQIVLLLKVLSRE